MERKIFKLDDSVLAQIVRLIQLGFLTGTDVVDHMRQLKLEEGIKAGVLSLTPEYVLYDKNVVTGLLENAEKLQEQEGQDQN